MAFFNNLGHRLAEITGDSWETTFLYQRLNNYLLPSSFSMHLLFMTLLALTSSKTSHPRTKKLYLIFLNPEGLHVPPDKNNNNNNNYVFLRDHKYLGLKNNNNKNKNNNNNNNITSVPCLTMSYVIDKK